MQENDFLHEQESPPTVPTLPEPRVRMVFLAQIGLMVFFSGVGMILYLLICTLAGWDASMALNADSPWADRWQVRLQLGLTHFFGFLVAGSTTVWIFYRGITQTRSGWPDYLQTREWPGWGKLLLGVLLMAAALPMVLFTLEINEKIPLPELFKGAGEQAEQALKGLLHMEHWTEFLANILIVAVLPAIGEELVFRGVVQQQLMRRIANPWVAILLSSIVFSAAHFQFDGFIPRLILGFLLGWLYWRTRNFWVPVVAHFFNNGLQVLVQYLYGKELSSIDLEKDIHVPVEFAVISAFMVWAVMRFIWQNKKEIAPN